MHLHCQGLGKWDSGQTVTMSEGGLEDGRTRQAERCDTLLSLRQLPYPKAIPEAELPS